MANNNSNIDLDALLGVARGAGSSADAIAQLNQTVTELQWVTEAQAASVAENTRAVDQSSTVGQASSGGSVLGSIGSTVESVLGFGFGLSPLISGLFSLFGGGGDSTPTPLTPYVAPSSANVQAGVSGADPGQAFGVDYGQGNQVRPVTSGANSGAQVTVNIQAMDSQSFLDRSTDIALAVRQAMLESSVLNDVIREV